MSDSCSLTVLFVIKQKLNPGSFSNYQIWIELSHLGKLGNRKFAVTLISNSSQRGKEKTPRGEGSTLQPITWLYVAELKGGGLWLATENLFKNMCWRIKSGQDGLKLHNQTQQVHRAQTVSKCRYNIHVSEGNDNQLITYICESYTGIVYREKLSS